MSTTLRRHNRQAADPVRIQLRAALHIGPVYPDPHGVSGHAVNHTARLLEAPALKEALATSGADLGFITSPFVYEFVAAHSDGDIPASAYRRLDVTVKETSISAWIWLPFTSPASEIAPAAPANTSANVSANVPAPPLAEGVTFSGEVRVGGDLVLGNKTEYRATAY
ncbi:hypothetical protein ACGFNU_16075 [Spirillospora sp. NPDC048911]|uniref:hypothetical protein n=1 Tax=Spirillospora sp. NPDC048911 TaxID=3364527 RepID=UPI00371EFAFC